MRKKVENSTGEKQLCKKSGFCSSLFQAVMECRDSIGRDYVFKIVKEEYLIFVGKHRTEQQD